MKIKLSDLQEIIKEEINSLIKEYPMDVNAEADNYSGSSDSASLMGFAKGYAQLGGAVQEQLHNLLKHGNKAHLESGAVKLMQDKVGGYDDKVDAAMDGWLSSHPQPSEPRDVDDVPW